MDFITEIIEAAAAAKLPRVATDSGGNPTGLTYRGLPIPGSVASGFSVYNITDYADGGDPTGVVDSAPAINAAKLVCIRGAVWNDPRVAEGGTVYLPFGKWRINSALNLNEGEIFDGRRQNLTLQGAGIGQTLLFSDTLKNMITASTPVDRLTIRDMTIISYATYTGAGTLEKLLDFSSCMFLNIERCRIYIRFPGADNPDAVLINLSNCYYSSITDCETITFSPSSSEKHNISLAANTPKFGGTHIRTNTTNALYITNHKWSNCYRGIHMINEDGVHIKGGAMEHYKQGFLLESSTKCLIEGVRVETHPESIFQYDGYDEQYTILCDERSTYNKFIGGSYRLNTRLDNRGHIDYNGLNAITPLEEIRKGERRTLIKNGDFALGGFTSGANFLIPGWTYQGTPTVVNETTDLPPEAGIKRVMKITTTASVAGIKASPIALDPERIPGVNWKFWMKRVSGDHSLRLMLSNAYGFPMTNALIYNGAITTQAKTGLPIQSATWAAGVLTVTAGTPKHFLKVNQRISIAGYSSGGINGSYLVASVVSPQIYTVALVADPGTITGTGTYSRFGIDDVAELDKWVEYRGFLSLRAPITGISAPSGGNVVITFGFSPLVPNVAGTPMKLFGISNPAYNATHNIVSSSGNTVTIADPGGAAPVHVGHGTPSISGISFYGWGGLKASSTFQFGAEFASPNVTADHLIGGVVIKPINGESLMTDDYISPLETLFASKAYDWPSIGANSTSTTTLTVAGAVAGDPVAIGLGLSNSGLQHKAQVTSADTVTIDLYNTTGASIDLSNATLSAIVTRLGV